MTTLALNNGSFLHDSFFVCTIVFPRPLAAINTILTSTCFHPHPTTTLTQPTQTSTKAQNFRKAPQPLDVTIDEYQTTMTELAFNTSLICWRCSKCGQNSVDRQTPTTEEARYPQPLMTICAQRTNQGVGGMICQYERAKLTDDVLRKAATIVPQGSSTEPGPLPEAARDQLCEGIICPAIEPDDPYWDPKCTASCTLHLGEHTFRDCCIGANCMGNKCIVIGEHTYGDCRTGSEQTEVVQVVRASSERSGELSGGGLRRSARLVGKEKRFYGPNSRR